MSKYVIIDEEAIQKEIEELKKQYDQKSKVNDNQWCSIISGQILALERILSKSTRLIPEIEKAFDTGKTAYITSKYIYDTPSFEDQKKDHISNLKLDI